MAQLGRLDDAVLLHQLQPLRDGVVHRALPAAIRIAAIQAAPGLVVGLGRTEPAVQLAPVAGRAQFQRNPPRHLARQIQELKDLLAAHAARLSVSASDSMLAALGFTSQNLPT